MLPLWLGAAEAIRSIEAARVHHAARRRGGGVAACGARTAGGGAGDRVPAYAPTLSRNARTSSRGGRIARVSAYPDPNRRLGTRTQSRHAGACSRKSLRRESYRAYRRSFIQCVRCSLIERASDVRSL